MIGSFLFGVQPCTHSKDDYDILFLKIKPFGYNGRLFFETNATLMCPVCQHIDTLKGKIITFEAALELTKLYNSNKKTSNANVYKLPLAAINKGHLISVPKS